MFSFCCAATAKICYADQSLNDEIVLRVTSDDVYFYSSNAFKDSDRYFKLTKTYFLIGTEITDGYFVRYKNDTPLELRGYVKKSEVEVYKEQKPSLIYPEISAISQGILSFYACAGDTLPKFSERVTNLECYGKITHNNKEYILVYYAGTYYNGLFYVNANDVSYIEPQIHPIPIKSADVDDNNNGDGEQSQNSDNPTNIDEIIQIVIIAAIVLFALLVVYLMFKPGNLKYKKNKE